MENVSHQLNIALTLWSIERGAHDRIVNRLNQRAYPESAAAYDTAISAGAVVSDVIDVAVKRIMYH